MGVHSLILRSDAERRRFIDVRQRLRLVAPAVVGVYLIAGLTGALTYGWAPLVPVAIGAGVYGLVWQRMSRLDHPEIALMATVLLAELSLAAAIALVPGAHAYVLPVLIMPVALAAAIFPSRVMTFVISFAAALTVAVAFAFGAHEVTQAPPVLMLPLVVLIIVAVALSALRDLDIATRQSAIVDELTGVLNRRTIMRCLDEEIARVRRSGQAASAALIDLDFFKRINDTFGHPAGDEALRTFALNVGANIRLTDRFGRYGGEEFLLVLPETELALAQVMLDRLRLTIGDVNWGAIADGLALSMSAGLCEVRGDDCAETILARADAALYRAKDAGRNRVIAA